MGDKRFDIPDIPQGIEPALRPTLVRLRQAIRDVITENGRLVAATQLLGGVAGPPGPIGPAGPGGGATTPDLTPPPTPTGLSVSAGIDVIFITHDAPTYTQGHGHDRTIVYGAKWEDPDTDPAPVFADAVVISEFQGAIHAYPTEPATTWCIWIKWRSNDGVLSTSPAGGTNGAQATTGADVSRLLAALTGQITESQLFASLGADIARTKVRPNIQPNGGLEFGLGSLVASVTGWYSSNDVWGRVAYNSTISSGTGDLLWPAFPVGAGSTYTVSADSVLIATSGSVWVDLAFYDSDGDFLSHGTPAGVVSGTHNFSESPQARVNHSAAFVAPPGAASARARFVWNTLVGATLVGVRHIKVENGGLPATYYTAEQSTVAVAAETNALGAQYTVKIDTNGYSTGYGLATTVANATPISSFIVRSDSFAVGSPSGPGITPAVPFIVRTTPGTVNGVAYPAGVYIDAAFILDLTAPIARMGNLWVTNAMVASLSAAKLTAGSIMVGQYIESTGFVSGSTGWRINGNGVAEFSGVVVRGTIVATAGAIGGATIGADYVQSAGYVANTSGWRLDNTLGKLFANSALIRNAAGTRMLDLDATSTNPVLKIGTAIEIKANGDATFGGVLTATEVVTTKNMVAEASTIARAAAAASYGLVTVTVTITADDIPVGGTAVPVLVTGSTDTLAVTFFDMGANQGSYTSVGNLVAALPPQAGIDSFTVVHPATVGTWEYSCFNHGVGNAPDVVNTRIRTITAVVAKR